MQGDYFTTKNNDHLDAVVAVVEIYVGLDWIGLLWQTCHLAVALSPPPGISLPRVLLQLHYFLVKIKKKNWIPCNFISITFSSDKLVCTCYLGTNEWKRHNAGSSVPLATFFFFYCLQEIAVSDFHRWLHSDWTLCLWESDAENGTRVLPLSWSTMNNVQYIWKLFLLTGLTAGIGRRHLLISLPDHVCH